MRRIASGTYRLQLHADFGFDAAADIADYLKDLGISHVYSSPYLQAAPGSKHGYDVVDHHKVNEELGGATAHARFSKRLGECGLGQVLDIVPNHMAIAGRRNRLWWDVLENGPSSRYSSYFDIDWEPHEQKLRNKLLVPILGDHYGRAIANGQIQVKRKGSEFNIHYAEYELPVAPKSLFSVISEAGKRSGSDELEFLADALFHLPAPTATDPASLAQRHRDKAIIAQLLDRAFHETPFRAENVDAVLKEINRSADRLDQFLEQQNYRLAHWRTAEQDLGYRRFFDVNTLVGVRMEDEHVFKDTHAVILNWLREGVLDGIRIDHPDGLRDPKDYFERLRTAASEDVWILGEKILEPGEQMPPSWPINGTTGYDFLNQAGGVLVDQSSEEALTNFYVEFTGQTADYPAVCRDKKHRVLRDLLGSDVNRLTSLFSEICEQNRDHRDYTRHDIMKAIRELVACFPVYRTYVIPNRDEISVDDVRYVEEAVAAAKTHRPEIDPDLLDFFADVLLLRARGDLETEFVFRFQQFSGPAMAKGVEDTTFYNYNRLLSLNEVGGDPGTFGVSVQRFHDLCVERQRTYPRGMLASSTHDTKRSEDVRARLSVLSEIPSEWSDAVLRWSRNNEKHKQHGCPDSNTEYFLYQTIVGAWPIGLDRLLPYMEKAYREAKSQTNWLTPNQSFEEATRAFIEATYQDREFMQDVEAFVHRVLPAGRINSLSQTLLKFTAPGVPDTYQGTEIWDLSLVDPDNRRPVDYNLRRQLLLELPKLKGVEVWKRMDEGLPKLWIVWHALKLRGEHTKCFGPSGDYLPLKITGSKEQCALAFARGKNIAVVITRMPVQLNGEWGDTTVDLPAGQWNNVLSAKHIAGGRVRLSELLQPFSVALLVRN